MNLTNPASRYQVTSTGTSIPELTAIYQERQCNRPDDLRYARDRNRIRFNYGQRREFRAPPST